MTIFNVFIFYTFLNKLKFNFRTSFLEFYPSAEYINVSTISNTRLTPSPCNFHVLDSIFISLIYSSHGGAIYASFAGAIVIEFCSFSEVSISSGNGGALYISTSLGTILKGVCASRCYTDGTTFAQFAIIGTSYTSPIKFLFSTISYCSPLSETRKQPIQIQKSTCTFSQFNSSTNQLLDISFAFFYLSLDLSIIFSTIVNCYSSDYRLLSYVHVYQSNISNTNFVNNSQVSSSFGLFYNENSTSLFFNCILKNNICSYLYYIHSGEITINSCYIDTYSFTFTAPIVLNSKTITQTHILSHLQTYLCPLIPLYPTFINTLNPTLEQTLNPTILETLYPTISETLNPTLINTLNPTLEQTLNPTISETLNPTILETLNPTISETLNPTISETLNPTILETLNPTISDLFSPTISDLYITLKYTLNPTIFNTLNPTKSNTLNPSQNPTLENSFSNTLNLTLNLTPISPTIIGRTLAPNEFYSNSITFFMTISHSITNTISIFHTYSIFNNQTTNSVFLSEVQFLTQITGFQSTISSYIFTYPEQTTELSNERTAEIAAYSVGGASATTAGAFIVMKYIETRSASVSVAVEINNENDDDDDEKLHPNKNQHLEHEKKKIFK